MRLWLGRNMQKFLGNLSHSARQKHREPSHQITQSLSLLRDTQHRVDRRFFLPFSKNSDLRFKFFKDMDSESTWEMENRIQWGTVEERNKGIWHLITLIYELHIRFMSLKMYHNHMFQTANGINIIHNSPVSAKLFQVNKMTTPTGVLLYSVQK